MCIRTHVGTLYIVIWYYVCWFYWLTFTRNETTDVLRQWPICIYIYIKVGERHFITHIYSEFVTETIILFHFLDPLTPTLPPLIPDFSPDLICYYYLVYLYLYFVELLKLFDTLSKIYILIIIPHDLTTNFLKRITIKWTALT